MQTKTDEPTICDLEPNLEPDREPDVRPIVEIDLDAVRGGAPAFGAPKVVKGGNGGKDQSRLPQRRSGETTIRKNVFKSAPLGKKGDRLDAPKSGWRSLF